MHILKLISIGPHTIINRHGSYPIIHKAYGLTLVMLVYCHSPTITTTPNNKTIITEVGLLSQPNNNHNPNKKINHNYSWVEKK